MPLIESGQSGTEGSPMTHVLDATEELAAHEQTWSLLQRLTFRFACIYLFLYLSDTWLGFIPGLGWFLGGIAERAWQGLGLWTASNILGITTEIDLHRLGTGSGDTLIEYIRVLCEMTIAAAGAIGWSIAARRKHDHLRLNEWLRVYVRYALGFTMLSYGMAKVFPGQFGPGVLSLDRMLEPYGHSSPMGLLWTFMGYSRPYTIFCGAAEVIGGMLLFWRRTTTLGALIVAAGMANVVMLNFSYDVPVKLYSSHLFLFAVLLLVPDFRRLVRLFFLNQTGTAHYSMWQRRAVFVLKIVVVAGAVYQTAWPYMRRLSQSRSNVAHFGIYDVDSFMLNGEVRPPASMDGKRWRRVIVNEAGTGITVQTMDDAMVRYSARNDASKKIYEMTTIFNPYEKIVLTYERPAENELVLRGNYSGDNISVRMKKVTVPSFLLATRD